MDKANGELELKQKPTHPALTCSSWQFKKQEVWRVININNMHLTALYTLVTYMSNDVYMCLKQAEEALTVQRHKS